MFDSPGQNFLCYGFSTAERDLFQAAYCLLPSHRPSLTWVSRLSDLPTSLLAFSTPKYELILTSATVTDDFRVLHQLLPDRPWVVVSAQPSIEQAVDAIHKGAIEYLDLVNAPPEKIAFKLQELLTNLPRMRAIPPNEMATLFEYAPVPLWIEDYSRVKQYLTALHQHGLSDLRAYFLANPQYLGDVMQLIRVLDINQAALRLLQVERREDVLGYLHKPDIHAENIDAYIQELIAVDENQTIASIQNFHNARLKDGCADLTMDWVVFPGNESNWEKVMVSLSDVTRLREAEKAERAARLQAETLRNAFTDLVSELDLNEVLLRTLIHLEKLIPYDSAAVILLENDLLTIVTGRGFPHPEQTIGQRFSIHDEFFFTSMGQTLRPIIIEDVQKESSFKNWGETSYVHGWMAIPFIAHGKILGYLTIDSRTPGAYHTQDAELALSFANEAAIAIENARLFRETKNLALSDPLTRLINRRHFFELAELEFNRAIRYHRPLSTIMIDLDNFKQVNDRYGHLCGDGVLIQIADLCKSQLRENDLIARYGGEEFVFLLPETSASQAAEVLDRLRQTISETGFRVGKNTIYVTVSIGVATLSPEHETYEDLIQHADQALYIAKHRGRNQVQVWGQPGSDLTCT